MCRADPLLTQRANARSLRSLTAYAHAIRFEQAIREHVVERVVTLEGRTCLTREEP